MSRNKALTAIDRLGESIGVGLLCGAVGTVAMTLGQQAEMRMTGRKAGVGPANAVGKTLQIQAKPGTKRKFSSKIHWVYGSVWGVARGVLALAGVKKWAATGAHFAAITGTAMVLAPLEGQKPVKEWTKKQVALDLLHHAVYAVAAGLVFDAVFNDKK